jgi:dihydroorotate dehydrogenase (NAD+) catalytic subunit
MNHERAAATAPKTSATEPPALDLSVAIGTMRMPNFVGLASGTFGYGDEYGELVDLDTLGALYTKAVTLVPRVGNPPPRLVETPAGMINSIGLANPGLEAFIREKLPRLRLRRCSVVVNVAGSTEDEYTRVIEGIESAAGPATASGERPSSGVDGYEINVSCPNVQHGGMAFGTDPFQVERLTRSLRARTARPLIIKLSPNVTDIAEIARAAEAGGANALSCINTLVGMAIDTKRLRPCIAMGTGGLSGPAIRPVGVACVWKVSRAVKIPVIGLGGISCADDALQYLLAGARAIQVGTATFTDPRCALLILSGIAAWMRERGVARVSDIRELLRS